MGRATHRDRAAPPPLPTTEQRLANLESWSKGFKAALYAWVAEHERRDKRWRETHASDHDALSDHVYALDAQVRRLQ